MSTATPAQPEAGTNGRDVDEDSHTTYVSWQDDSPRPFSPSASIAESLGSVHSMHLQHLQPHELRAISRVWITSRDLEPPPPPLHRNPTVRAFRWYQSWAVPGMGMFVEAWMIFALGNIMPLLKVNFPHCFGGEEPTSCSQSAVSSVTYVEVCGIILGMLVLGFCADIIGRMWSSRLASSVMLLGSAMLTGCAGSSDSGFLTMFLNALFILGAGVGGEYPVASSSAVERAEGSKQMRRRRGETVVLTFSQQGWGNFFNTLTVLLLLTTLGATGQSVGSWEAEVAWRVQFAVGTAICLALVAYRWTLLQESKVWKAERHDVAEHLAQKGVRGASPAAAVALVTHPPFATWQTQSHHSQHEYRLIFNHYWPRLLVTCVAWGLSGFLFYGQKLFQSTFISVIAPDASVFRLMQYTLLNNGVALVGYYAAAALIDRPWFGRVRMQALGFFMLFLLFMLQGALYNVLLENALGVFQFLYYFSAFWQNLGPNCTTWLVASEVYPTTVRSCCNGMSAAAGKAGALVAAATFGRISPRAAFYASAGAGLLGFLLTWLFLPDTTGLDLHEVDRMNHYLLAGQLKHYHGEACNPRFLSLYERLQRYDRDYMPERDYAHKKLQRNPHMPEEPPPPSLLPQHLRQLSRMLLPSTRAASTQAPTEASSC